MHEKIKEYVQMRMRQARKSCYNVKELNDIRQQCLGAINFYDSLYELSDESYEDLSEFWKECEKEFWEIFCSKVDKMG